MPRRCRFEYNSRLILHYDAPVFTTVVYLVPGSDSGVQDAFRLFLADRLAYERRFDVVRLWEIDVGVALESGQTGPLALVPLLHGGDDPEKVLAAVRMLDALPPPASTDGITSLLDLASRRYDRATFSNVLGKDRVMQCPKLSGPEFAALVTGSPPEPVARSRTSRPSRTSHRPGRARRRSRAR